MESAQQRGKTKPVKIPMEDVESQETEQTEQAEAEDIYKLLGDELSEVAKFAARLLQRTGAYSVLCPACGQGDCSAYLAHHGFRVTAYDISERTCSRVRAKANLLGVSIDCFTDDVIMPRRELRHFDAIFAHNTLHQLRPSQRRAMLRSFHRALRPAGIVIVSVLSMEDERYGYGRQLEEDTFDSGTGEGIHFYSAPELHEELSQYFEVAQIEEMEETHIGFGGKQRYRLLVATGVKVD